MSQADFLANEMAQSAIIREIQVIGEAARMISDETKAAQPEIAWSGITGMRNRIIHEYFDVDLGIVWSSIQADIPSLVRQLAQSVPSEDDDPAR